MDWPEFWTGVFASSGAAAIAFVSAAVGFTRARRAERREGAARERRNRIGAVQAAVHSDLMRAATRLQGLHINRGVIRVNDALVSFATAEWVEHEAVARWATERGLEMASALAAAQRWWLLPGNADKRIAVVKPAAEIASMLALWERGALDDAWFAERLSEQGRADLARNAVQPGGMHQIKVRWRRHR